MLHLKTIDPELFQALSDLSELRELSNFALVGGTALSLQIGHRKSEDLDFFTDRSFDIQEVKEAVLRYNPRVELLDERKHGISLILPLSDKGGGRKLDIYNWAVRFIRPVKHESAIRLASLEDIAAFKLDAICLRKEKKDYIDLAVLLTRFSFGDLIDFYREKFPMNDKRIVLTQILDTEGIENSLEPVMLADLSFEAALSQIKQKVDVYAAEQIGRRDTLEENRLKRISDLIDRRDKGEHK